MSTKQRIHAVIDDIAEENLDELFEVVRTFADARNGKPELGLMERLLAAKKFDGPPDFAENLDQYLSGEKDVEDHIR